MKFTIRFFLLILSVLSVCSLQAQKSKNQSSDNNLILKSVKPKFQITFPVAYKLEEKKTENSLKSMFYRAVKNDDVYMFKFTEHKNPAVSSDNQMYMNASLESFINGINADLIKKFQFNEKKETGLEAFMKISDKNLYVFYRVLIIKHVQYQLIVISKSEQKTENINNFFNSFSF